MKKNMLLLMLLGLFIGCVIHDNDFKCYESNLFASVNYLTMTQSDSVVFKIENREMIKEFNESFICKDSTKSIYFVTDTISNFKNYMCSKAHPLWYAYHIFLGTPMDKTELNAIKIDLIIYHLGKKTEIDISGFINGGEITNIIAEKDTTYWFNQKENLIRPYFSDYETPAQSKRLGCRDNFCAASVPMAEKEFCDEK